MAVYSLGPPQGVSGFKCATWKDERFNSPGSLLASAVRRLDSLTRPEISYRITATDLAGVRLADHEELSLGELVHVIDDALGLDAWVRVVAIERGLGEANDIGLELDTATRDATDYIADAIEAATIDLTETGGAPPAWQSDKTDEDGNALIDGAMIERGTLPETFLAEITADTTTGSEQRYTVEVLDPIDGSALSAAQIEALGLDSATITNAMVPDDTAAALSVGSRMPMKLPSRAQRSAGEHPLLTPPGFATGSGSTTAQWLFISTEGEQS